MNSKKQLTENRKKERLYTALMSFSTMGSILFFPFFLINSFFSQGYWVYTIIIGIIALILGLIFLKSLSDWGFEPYKEIGFQRLFMISGLILVIIIPVGLANILMDIKEEWNNYCAEKRLPNKCSPFDECRIDCQALNQELYRYEGGGFFKNPDCWCIDNDKTKQIW